MSTLCTRLLLDYVNKLRNQKHWFRRVGRLEERRWKDPLKAA